MVKDSIDVLGLLRKRGLEGDVDFLREALAVRLRRRRSWRQRSQSRWVLAWGAGA